MKKICVLFAIWTMVLGAEAQITYQRADSTTSSR